MSRRRLWLGLLRGSLLGLLVPALVSGLAMALLVPSPATAQGSPETRAVLAAAYAGRVPPPAFDDHAVLAISIDGLNPSAIQQLGPAGAPTLYRWLQQGASTLNARTEVEQTVTLPNHTGMLTGRRVDAAAGGHGVTWDDDRPGSTVQQAAGHPVDSVFTVVHQAGGSTALFAAKTKFTLYQRSWPGDIDRFLVNTDDAALVRIVAADLVSAHRAFTFVHLALPDLTGHASGFMSPAYVAAVRTTDQHLAILLRTIEADPALRQHLVVILTSDHGGFPGSHSHSFADRLADYRVPFLVWGPGVRPGDLYALDPGYADPGTGRPSYAGTQPVRNGDLANLATSLLGLGPVPGSLLDARQNLAVLR